MQIKIQNSLIQKPLYVFILLALLLAASLSPASAQGAAGITPVLSDRVLSDGQFVYGPNVGGFKVKAYLEANAPHLLTYADDIYERSEYFSINPKVYLTLLEVHSQLISAPGPAAMGNPFGLNSGDLISQIEDISASMSDAYYLHLYTYSPLPVSERALKPFITPSGVIINAASDTNAGTYAIIAALAAMDEKNISAILDNSQPNGFYQTYVRLFGNDNPLDETNRITVPGQVGAQLVAPDGLLQLPWLRGTSWFFSGVHSNGSGGNPTAYTDASALDFGPGGLAWGGDTSTAWVVAAASGVPTKISNCFFYIVHSDGWETTYYHLENIQSYAGSINQNDKIGVPANTLAEATCSGGSASGPHVHFNLKHNGALIAINGTPLSGWYVHAGRYNYDLDVNYMWLERGGVKKFAQINKLLSEAPPSTAAVLVNSVLPTSRTVPVGTTATIFNTVINASTNAATGITLSMSPVPAGTFAYQQTDCATNAIISGLNPSLDLTAGGVLCYVLSFTPSLAFAATNVHIRAQAANAPATDLLTGINTWLLRATDVLGPDIIALTTTTDFHQVACSGLNVFAVALSNVGAAAASDITVTANTGTAVLPLTFLIQETTPATGVIIGDNILQTVGAGENRTVAVFVTFNGCIAFDPAANRIFIEFKDASGNVVGSTSTAVSTGR